MDYDLQRVQSIERWRGIQVKIELNIMIFLFSYNKRDNILIWMYRPY